MNRTTGTMHLSNTRTVNDDVGSWRASRTINSQLATPAGVHIAGVDDLVPRTAHVAIELALRVAPFVTRLPSNRL